MKAEVLVKLAARDPWSFTVLDTLKRKFGLESLVSVERLKSWQLDFDLDSEQEVLGVCAKILEGTALLANPNRDIWTVRGLSGVDLPGGGPDHTGMEGRFFAVRVTDRDDLVGRSMLAVLRRRLGISEITAVTFSLVWIVEFDGQGDDPVGLAQEVAVARSFRRGLLANPHSQQAVVMGLADYLGGSEGVA